MKLHSRLIAAVLAAGFSFVVQRADAVLISGSFTGNAVRVSGLNPPFLSVRAGDVVTGSFSLDTSPFELIGGDGSTSAGFWYRDLSFPPRVPQPLHIVFEVPARAGSYELAGPAADVTLTQTSSGQGLELLTGYGGNTPWLALTLFGGPAAFFPALDLSGLHGGDVDLSRSYGAFGSRALSFDVVFSSFSFDPLSVPEPESLPLAATAIAALILAWRRRARV
ncbi:PEP-CTERM sorting domain-containing protein [Uliginosibacterium sp. H3]|uniref:PEP-CTERM sorting domain-containing protein n=1 Tax=Uliginosibacterium silvisoli TaxID=3114758 RepID=A0ABU6JYX6_9RHOO|nr:PEP-CTERM sorting domain-containing protein [Uliginosibacterium sp. H3]